MQKLLAAAAVTGALTLAPLVTGQATAHSGTASMDPIGACVEFPGGCDIVRNLPQPTNIGSAGLGAAKSANVAQVAAVATPVLEPCAFYDWSPYCRPRTNLEYLLEALNSGSSSLSAKNK